MKILMFIGTGIGPVECLHSCLMAEKLLDSTEVLVVNAGGKAEQHCGEENKFPDGFDNDCFSQKEQHLMSINEISLTEMSNLSIYIEDSISKSKKQKKEKPNQVRINSRVRVKGASMPVRRFNRSNK